MKRIISRRSFLKAAGFGVGAAALAACSAPASPAPASQSASGAAAAATVAPAAASGKAVELRVAWWGSQDRHDRTIKVINLYMKQNPNVKITYEFAGFNDYLTKMTTYAAADGLPDVLQQDYAWIAEWAGRGLIIPLDDYAKSGALNFADVGEEYLSGGRVNSKLVAINLGANSQTFALNTALFQKAGVELPADTWTWDDHEKIATTLKDKLGIWAQGAGLWNEQLWKSLYLSLGSWAYANDGTQLGYTDDKPFIDYLKRLVRYQKAGLIPSLAEDLSTYDGKGLEALPMALGKAVSESFWSNQIVATWKAMGGEDKANVKLVPLPRLAGGKSSNYIKPSQFFSVSKSSKTPDEAAKFIDFFTNNIEANAVLFAERGVPISSKVRESMQPKLGKAQKEMFDFVQRMGKLAEPIRPPDPKGASDIIKNVYRPLVIEPVMYEKTTPEEAAAVLRKEANTILAKNKA